MDSRGLLQQCYSQDVTFFQVPSIKVTYDLDINNNNSETMNYIPIILENSISSTIKYCQAEITRSYKNDIPKKTKTMISKYAI